MRANVGESQPLETSSSASSIAAGSGAGRVSSCTKRARRSSPRPGSQRTMVVAPPATRSCAVHADGSRSRARRSARAAISPSASSEWRVAQAAALGPTSLTIHWARRTRLSGLTTAALMPPEVSFGPCDRVRVARAGPRGGRHLRPREVGARTATWPHAVLTGRRRGIFFEREAKPACSAMGDPRSARSTTGRSCDKGLHPAGHFRALDRVPRGDGRRPAEATRGSRLSARTIPAAPRDPRPGPLRRGLVARGLHCAVSLHARRPRRRRRDRRR